MQESGKGTANGSGGDPTISADRAEELAASFRPAWDTEEPVATTTETSGPPVVEPAPAVVVAPVIMVAPAAPAASEAHAATPVPQAPRPAPVPAPVSAPARIPDSKPRQAARPPIAKVAAVDADPFGAASASDSDIAVPKKSRGVLYALVGVGVAAGTSLVLKFTMAEDAKPAPTPMTHADSKPPTMPPTMPPTKEEIPPPPPRDEAPPAAIAQAEPAKATAPVKAPEPKATPAGQPRPPMPAAAPAAPAAPPAPKAEPKTAPKAGSGGIVRDNPF